VSGTKRPANVLCSSVADPHHVVADPDHVLHFDVDPDPTFHSDADPDPDPTFQFDVDPDPTTDPQCFKMTTKASNFSL
jgi:hypothetical protein